MTARDGAAARLPSLSCVVLTMGDRPADVARALQTLRDQTGDPIETVVVGNGVQVEGLPEGVATLTLPENVGIPAGRNAGYAATTGDLVFFLDDDGWLPHPGTAQRVREQFAADPRLGILTLRILDPETGQTQRRHVPRLRASDPGRSSDVTTFLGGGSVVRRAVLDQVGPLPGTSSSRTRRPTWRGGRSTRAGGSATTPARPCATPPRRPRGTPCTSG